MNGLKNTRLIPMQDIYSPSHTELPFPAQYFIFWSRGYQQDYQQFTRNHPIDLYSLMDSRPPTSRQVWRHFTWPIQQQSLQSSCYKRITEYICIASFVCDWILSVNESDCFFDRNIMPDKASFVRDRIKIILVTPCRTLYRQYPDFSIRYLSKFRLRLECCQP